MRGLACLRDRSAEVWQKFLAFCFRHETRRGFSKNDGSQLLTDGAGAREEHFCSEILHSVTRSVPQCSTDYKGFMWVSATEDVAPLGCEKYGAVLVCSVVNRQ